MKFWGNMRVRICSKLRIKILEKWEICSKLIVNLEPISHLFLVLLSLTLTSKCSWVPSTSFSQVITIFLDKSAFQILNICQCGWFFSMVIYDDMLLIFSWWRSLPYRNQSIDLLYKSMEWFLYDRDVRHEKVKICF